MVAVQDPLEPLDPAALFFAAQKRVIKGTLKYHDSRPGGLPGRMVGPLAPGGDPLGLDAGVGPVDDDGRHRRSRHPGRAPATSRSTPSSSRRSTTSGRGPGRGGRSPTTPSSVVPTHACISGSATTTARSTVDLPPGTRRRRRRSPTSPASNRWEPLALTGGRPALHELAAVARDADGRALDRRARHASGCAPRGSSPTTTGRPAHLEVNGRPVFVKAVNYIPWQHFAEVGRELLRPRHAAARRGPRQLGRRARARPVAALLRRGRRRRHPRRSRTSRCSGSTTRAPRPIPGFVDEAPAGRSRTWRYLLHAHPSVVYYACHNEPLRMFDPTASPTTTPGARPRRAPPRRRALATALRAIDDSAGTSTRRRASATTCTTTSGR